MSVGELVSANTPACFWRLSEPVADDLWAAAIDAAQARIAWPFPVPLPIDAFLETTLGEAQFGPRRYELGRLQRGYYGFARPLIPTGLRPILRRFWRSGRTQFALGWPIEDRYARFQYEVLRQLGRLTGRTSLEIHWFWPDKAEFALCLTHDVEARAGYESVPEVMALEERLGFRSSFNFVAAEYAVDPAFLRELRRRGFDYGVHGWDHKGRLFASKDGFRTEAAKINETARTWETGGFRSPLTHRHPEWMQALEIDHDSSFFDTDPYEPMPGGTMSIWPFALGRFVELPYTLPQDHTLFEMGLDPVATWTEKLAFIRRYHGVALLNVHPDYLRTPRRLDAYERLLEGVRERGGFWQALPRTLAERWRSRMLAAEAPPGDRVRVVVDGDGEPRVDLGR